MLVLVGLNVNLSVLVCLPVRGVQDFLNHEHRVFNSEEFLRTREPADQSFYKKVHTHTFAQTHTNTHTLTHKL